MTRFVASLLFLFCSACSPRPADGPPPFQRTEPNPDLSSHVLPAGAPAQPAWQLLRLGQPRVGHAATVLSLAWSADGQRFCSSSADASLRIWDANDGAELLRIQLAERVLGACFSADGMRLLAVCGPLVRVWDAVTGVELRSFSCQAPILSSARGADGRLALGCEDGSLELWSWRSGERLAHQPEAHEGGVYALAWSPSGQLASGGTDGQVQLWDGGLRSTGSLDLDDAHVMSLAWAPDGRLAAGCDQDTVRIFSTGLALLQTDRGAATWWVRSLCFSPDGEGLWIQPLNAAARLLRGSKHTTFPANGDPLAFSPDGQILLMGQTEGDIERWQVDEPLKRPFEDHDPINVHALALTRDGFQLVTAQDHGVLRVYSCENGGLLAERHHHDNGVREFAWGAAVEHEARWQPVMHSLSEDLETTWLVDSWEAVESHYKGLPRNYVPAPEDRDLAAARAQLAADHELTAARYSTDRRFLAAGYADGRLELWDLAGGKLLIGQRVHAEAIHLLAFDGEARRLASAGLEGCLGLYELGAFVEEPRSP